MLRYAFLLFLALSIVSCRSVQEPELRSFENLKVENFSKDAIELSGEAVLYNPNAFGIEISAAHFEVYIKDEKMGVIDQHRSAEIKPKEEFVYPIKATLDLDKLGSGFLGKLGKALQIFSEKEIDLLVEGNFTVKVMGKDIKIPFKHREKVSL